MARKDQESQRHMAASTFVQDMINQGELEVDERGIVQPLGSKMKH